MNGFLKAQTFGMPRWAWLALLAGGAGLGLYLRSRRAAAATAEEMVPGEESTQGMVGDTLGEYEDAGLAGVGVVGPPGGSVVPVSSPTIPEGFVSVFETLGATIGSLAGAITEGKIYGVGATSETSPVEAGGGGVAPAAAAPVQPKPKANPTGGGAPNNRPGVHDKPKAPAIGVAPAVPVAPPPPANNAAHPAAVNTGNPCVKGGVGGHTAPPGYHLFCQGGWIWRAPNS